MTVVYRNPIGLHPPTDNLYSHVSVADGRHSYRIGGQVALDAEGRLVATDMAGQIRCCYEMVTTALRALGLDWRAVTHLNTFTTHMDEYLRAERAIAPSFFGSTPPPSTLVEVSRLVDPAWLVEVQADASSD